MANKSEWLVHIIAKKLFSFFLMILKDGVFFIKMIGYVTINSYTL